MSVNSTNRSILANYLMGQGSSSTIGRNYVRNEFARDGVANVTASGTATVAKNTTTPLTAISDFLVTLPNNTTDYVEWTLDTLDNALKNQNCMMSFDYLSTTVGSAVQAQIVIGGTVVSTSNISTAAGQSQVRLNAPCGTLAGATTVRISNATGNTGTSSLNVANMNYGRADNVYDAPLVTAWTAYTPTFTGFGTPSSVQFQYRRNGSDLEVRGKFTSGTSTATEARVSFPTGLTSSGTSVIPSIRLCGDQIRDTNASIYFRDAVLCEPSVSYATFGKQTDTDNSLTKQLGTGMASSGRVISLSFSVPILGWSAVSAVSADQTDYDWTSYTPTFTGFGTVTSPECQHSRVASNLLLRCKYIVGTTTATEARVSLPTGLTSADINKIPTIQNIGYVAFSGTSSNYNILIEPSVTYVTFAAIGTNGLSKINGSSMTSGLTHNIFASIPIQGWSSNQRAPTLVGSVTSNSTGAERMERLVVANSGTPTITSQSGSWVSSLTDNGVGDVTVNIPSGSFSSAPTCSVTRNASGGGFSTLCAINTVSTTAINVQCSNTSTATLADAGFNLICMGPR